MSEWNLRLAEPKDAQSFADWAAHNPQIDAADLAAGLTKNNPTVLTFVAEKDGVPVWFAPVYLAGVLAHMCPNPEVDGLDRLRGLQVMTDGVMAFMAQFGIREIQTQTKLDYPIARWAMRHGFEFDGRETLKLDINEQMVEAK
jgi:hypothetical protein